MATRESVLPDSAAILKLAKRRVKTLVALSLAPVALSLAGITPVGEAGLTIIPTFDSSITSDPNSATIEATIEAAIAVYAQTFSDPITVSIMFQEMSSGLGGAAGTMTRSATPITSADFRAMRRLLLTQSRWRTCLLAEITP